MKVGEEYDTLECLTFLTQVYPNDPQMTYAAEKLVFFQHGLKLQLFQKERKSAKSQI